jgi:hypothetical protein
MKCARGMFLFLALATLLAGRGQADAADKATSRSKTDETKATVNFVLHPAAEPRSSLKYQLLPPLLETQHENAAVHYLMIHVMESRGLQNEQQKAVMLMDYAKMPLADLRKARDADRKATEKGHVCWSSCNGWLVDEIKRGNRCDYCNWDLPLRDPDYVSVRVPPLLYLVNAARKLCVSARLQMADGRFDEAAESLQTTMALGRRIGDGADSLLFCAVGNVIVDKAIDQIETFVQQPDSPNLYWALATLPRPMIDLRPALIRGWHGIYIDRPELRDLGKQKHTPQQWQKMLDRLVDYITNMYDGAQEPPSQDARKLKIYQAVMEGYPRAKKYLIAQGRSASEVETMSVPQVALLYTMQRYDDWNDRMAGLAMLPYTVAGSRLRQLERELADTRNEIIPQVNFYLARSSSRIRSVLMDRRIAALAVLEAIRIYAAGHGGRLPEKLADVVEVPIPNDPTRDEPFVYRRENDAAILESPLPPPTVEPMPALRYRIEMKPIEKPAADGKPKPKRR